MFNILDYFALCLPIYFVLKVFNEEGWKAFIAYYNYYTVFSNYYNRVYKIKWHIIYLVTSISFVVIKLIMDLNLNITLYLLHNDYLKLYSNTKIVQETLFYIIVTYLFLKPIIISKKFLNLLYITFITNILAMIYYLYQFNFNYNVEAVINDDYLNTGVFYADILVFLTKFILVIFTIFLTYNFSNRLKSGEIELFEKLDTSIYDKEYINKELDSRNKILIK